MTGHQARVLMLRGKWSEAAELARQLLRRSTLSPVSRINPLTVSGRIGARRGDPDASRVLDEALEVARPTGEIQRLGPVYAARAEAAWLDGDREAALQAARAGFDLAEQGNDRWILAELACWRRRLGDVFALPHQATGPFALEAQGRWQEATAEWVALDCPYEAAMASIEGDQPALREALRVLANLGATRAVEAVARRASERGYAGLAG